MAQRTLDEVTDDEFVNAIAIGGMGGVYMYEATSLRPLVVSMKLPHGDLQLDHESMQQLCAFTRAFHQRLARPQLVGRITFSEWGDGNRILMLTPKEWGKRLTGKTADEIRLALEGEP